MSNIKEALGKLDHQNDDHWTSNGKPKISVVRELAGNAGITAKEIKAADPNLSRIVITENKSDDNKENEQEQETKTIADLNDEELVEVSSEDIIKFGDVDVAYRYIDLQREIIKGEVDELKAVQKRVDDRKAEKNRVNEFVETKPKHIRDAEDAKSLNSWLNAQAEETSRQSKALEQLNLDPHQRDKAVSGLGTLPEKIADSLKN